MEVMRDERRGARDNGSCPAPLTHLLNTYLAVTIVCWALYQLCEPVLCEGTLLLETKYVRDTVLVAPDSHRSFIRALNLYSPRRIWKRFKGYLVEFPGQETQL